MHCRARAPAAIDPASLPVTEEQLHRDLNSVVPLPAAKLYFGFASAPPSRTCSNNSSPYTESQCRNRNGPPSRIGPSTL
jgi:hypothetical protein